MVSENCGLPTVFKSGAGYHDASEDEQQSHRSTSVLGGSILSDIAPGQGGPVRVPVRAALGLTGVYY